VSRLRVSRIFMLFGRIFLKGDGCIGCGLIVIIIGNIIPKH